MNDRRTYPRLQNLDLLLQEEDLVPSFSHFLSFPGLGQRGGVEHLQEELRASLVSFNPGLFLFLHQIIKHVDQGDTLLTELFHLGHLGLSHLGLGLGLGLGFGLGVGLGLGLGQALTFLGM